jgi:four helix bundle protein
MAGIRRFEDLIAWQKARILVKEINLVMRDGPGSKDFGFRKQITTAALSVMSNIAEGFERGTKQEFHQFLVIAGSSCGEARSQLFAALDLEYVCETKFAELYEICDHTGRLTTALRKSLGVERKRH